MGRSMRVAGSRTGYHARAGFAKVGERRNYYRGADMQPHDAHTYMKRLD